MLQKIGKNIKRASFLKSHLSLKCSEVSFYDVVYAIEFEGGFQKVPLCELEIQVTLAFKKKEDALSYSSNGKIIPIMLGKLIGEVQSSEKIEVIGIDYEGQEHGKFSEFVFAPFFDKLTGQYLITPSNESIALLSIDKVAHKHMGVKATFFSINNKFLPEEGDERKALIEDLVEDVSFMIPRIAQPRGSANIICMILNLDNNVEERAFIRKYKTLDQYTEVLFVTSELKILTGELEEIEYNGMSLEGIYLPIIKRQLAN